LIVEGHRARETRQDNSVSTRRQVTPKSESGRRLPQSKSWRILVARWTFAKRLGLRQPSRALAQRRRMAATSETSHKTRLICPTFHLYKTVSGSARRAGAKVAAAPRCRKRWRRPRRQFSAAFARWHFGGGGAANPSRTGICSCDEGVAATTKADAKQIRTHASSRPAVNPGIAPVRRAFASRFGSELFW